MNDNIPNTYSGGYVCKISGLEKSSLAYYVRQGIIVPYEINNGRYGRHKYTEYNIREAIMCKSLRGVGIEPHRIRDILDHMRNNGGEYRLGGTGFSFYVSMDFDYA